MSPSPSDGHLQPRPHQLHHHLHLQLCHLAGVQSEVPGIGTVQWMKSSSIPGLYRHRHSPLLSMLVSPATRNVRWIVMNSEHSANGWLLYLSSWEIGSARTVPFILMFICKYVTQLDKMFGIMLYGNDITSITDKTPLGLPSLFTADSYQRVAGLSSEPPQGELKIYL